MMAHSRELSAFPMRVITTLSQERRQDRDIQNNQFVLPNRTGESLHTTFTVDERGERVWLVFDPSRVCRQFPTTETRFYKPKLHRHLPDPYQKRF